MTSPRRAALVLVAALSLLVAGCGGDTESKNDYVDSVNKVQTDFANSVQKSASAVPSGGDAAQAAKDTFATLESAIDKLVGDLRGIEPPDDVKQLHDRLISQMNEFKGDISKAGDALGSNDPQAIAKAQTDFATSAGSLGTEISQTITEINQQLQE